MMKKINILLLAMLCLTTAWAQDFTLVSTPEAVNELNYSHWDEALGQDETGFYTIGKLNTSISNQQIYLKKFSPSLNLLFTKNIPASFGTFNDSKTYLGTEMANGQIFVFYRGWDKNERQVSIHVKMLNPETGNLSNDFVLLESEFSKSQMNSANFVYSFSPDGSKMLVLTEKPFEKKQSEEVRLQVFNTADFSSLWKKDLVLKDEYKRGRSNSIAVNNNGISYIFKEFIESSTERKYSLVTTNAVSSSTTPITFNEYIIGETNIFIDEEGNLNVGAILSDQPKFFSVSVGSESNWQGLWLFKAGEDGNVMANTTYALTSPELQALTANAKRESIPGKNIFKLKDVIKDASNGTVFLIEHTAEKRNTIPNSSPIAYEYNLTHKGIYAIAFDENNAYRWNQVLNKNQVEMTLDPKLYYGSFTHTFVNDKLYLFWNYMEVRYESGSGYRYWINENNQMINIDHLYGKEALHPTLMTVIDNQGNFEYGNRAFQSLPLHSIQMGNFVAMAMNPALSFGIQNGIILISQMPGGPALRYKLSQVNF